jgi:hypothetical protein
MHPEHDLIKIHVFVIFKFLMTVVVNPIVFFDMTTCIYSYIDTLYVPTSMRVASE